MSLKKCVVLASGRGSNFEALIKGAINYKIQALICDKEAAPVLQIAKENNIDSIIISSSTYKGAVTTRPPRSPKPRTRTA